MSSSDVQNTPPVNGGSSNPPSLAAVLEKQHDQHQATVEDAVDEYDLAHPRTSSPVREQKPEPSANSAPPQEQTPPSPEASPPKTTAPSKKKPPALDVHSEESFPALGIGSKPPTAVPATWAAKRPSVAAAATTASNGVANGSQKCT